MTKISTSKPITHRCIDNCPFGDTVVPPNLETELKTAIKPFIEKYKQLRSVVEFYAAAENWHDIALRDRGVKARKILEELGK